MLRQKYYWGWQKNTNSNNQWNINHVPGATLSSIIALHCQSFLVLILLIICAVKHCNGTIRLWRASLSWRDSASLYQLRICLHVTWRVRRRVYCKNPGVLQSHIPFLDDLKEKRWSWRIFIDINYNEYVISCVTQF